MVSKINEVYAFVISYNSNTAVVYDHNYNAAIIRLKLFQHTLPESNRFDWPDRDLSVERISDHLPGKSPRIVCQQLGDL